LDDSIDDTFVLVGSPMFRRGQINPLITLDAYARSTTPAKIEAQGWVMQQLLMDDSKAAALAAAKPASTRTM
jgi:hypothetical protein